MTFRTPVALAVAVSALLVANPASAHAKLVTSSPPANAASAAPPHIQLQFNEKLQARFSGFEVSSKGAAVPVKVAPGKDGLSLVGTPARPLTAGVYEVKWHAVTADTHRMQGAFSFTVR